MILINCKALDIFKIEIKVISLILLNRMALHGLFLVEWTMPPCARWNYQNLHQFSSLSHAAKRIQSCTFDKDKIWRPDFVVRNSIDGDYAMEKISKSVKIQSYGNARWFAGGKYKITCKLSYRQFPFDVNTCCIEFFSRDDFDDVQIEQMDIIVMDGFLVDGDVWTLEKAYTHLQKDPFYRTTEMSACFVLRRKGEYYIMTVFIPMASIMLMQLLTVIIDPDLDRTSFAVTVMLAMAVYQQIFVGLIPKTAEPVYLFYYIMYQILLGGLITAYIVINSSIRQFSYFRQKVDMFGGRVSIAKSRHLDLIVLIIAALLTTFGNVAYFLAIHVFK